MTRFRRVHLLLLCATLTLTSAPLLGQDEPAKDNPSVPRFPGMVMEFGRATDFDAFEFPISGDGKTQRAEGKSWEFTYNLKEGARQPSPLEVVRNYANQFSARGGKVLYQLPDATEATMMMPLGAGQRWLHLLINNGGEQILMNIIETAAMEQKVEFSADQIAAQVAATGRITLRGILFDTAKTDIRPESNTLLDEVAGMMRKSADVRFQVEGHTDNVGNKASNLTLSRGRAASVKAALESRGIAADRLGSEGFGDTRPVASNDTEEGRSQNRRVELVRR